MLGAIDSWFTTRLAGLDQAPGSGGCRELCIAPAVVGDLTSACATYSTPYGEAAGPWQRDMDRLSLTVGVSAGTTATIEVPFTSGRGTPDGARLVVHWGGVQICQVGSGTWTFKSSFTPGR